MIEEKEITLINLGADIGESDGGNGFKVKASVECGVGQERL